MPKRTEPTKFYRFIVSERSNRSMRCEGVFDSEDAAKDYEGGDLLPGRYRCVLRDDQLTSFDRLLIGRMDDTEVHTDEDAELSYGVEPE